MFALPCLHLPDEVVDQSIDMQSGRSSGPNVSRLVLYAATLERRDLLPR
ncbi:hypothetical protein [uncultured Lamprocystis sp.]|nr:hypothetical protein [uncultured Lamprocystis sp.]